MKLRCPVCHSSASLEAYVADDAGRELLVLLAGSGPAFRPLVHYLGLFRSGSRDLAHDRALRLAQEALGLEPDRARLAVALSETVEAMRAKRQNGGGKPLTNHNYLKRVLESLPEISPVISPVISSATSGVAGRRAQAVAALRDWAGNDWLRLAIANGMTALVADNRQGAPGADTITATAGLWETLLRDSGVTIQEVDSERIYQGFKALLREVKGWPEGKDLLARMPRRKDLLKIEHEVSDEERARVTAGLREWREKKGGGCRAWK